LPTYVVGEFGIIPNEVLPEVLIIKKEVSKYVGSLVSLKMIG